MSGERGLIGHLGGATAGKGRKATFAKALACRRSQAPSGAEMVLKTRRVKDEVEQILREYPSSRGDDRVLIYRYVRNYCPQIKLSFKSFEDLFKIPSFETIRRRGQELRREHDELQPTEKTQKKRFRRAEAMKNYYGSGMKITDFGVWEA